MDLSDDTAISAEQMRAVLEVTRLLAVTPDIDTLLNRIARSATALLSAERASIFLHDPKSHELWTRVALGAKEIRVPDTAGIVGHVFQSNELLLVSKPYEDPRFNREVDRKTGFVTRNLLTVPARDMTRKPIGVLQLVNRIGGDFSDNDAALIEILADQVGVAIQRHYLQQEVIKAASLEHEMELAQHVQLAMIPQTPPQIAGIQSAGWNKPASLTGGDAYDLWQTPDGRMGIFVGDASGHGIAPAIVVSQARTLARSLCELNCDPAWLLTRINSRLANDLEMGRFVTIFLGFISPDGVLDWCSAGHGPMILRPGADQALRLLEPMAPPIGILSDLPCDGTARELIAPGGMLAVMSDGIFEARSATGELFEVDRVVKLLETHRAASPRQLVDLLRQAVIEWQGNKDEPVDDQTLAIIQRTPF